MGKKSLRGLLVYLGHFLTDDDVKVLVGKIYAARPGLKRLIDDCSRKAAEEGCIRNPFGRWVGILPDATYKALNAYIQGLGGDIMRYSLVRVHRAIKENNWPLKLLLTVHDEIVGEMPESAVDEVAPGVAKIMETIPMVDLPLPVDVEICRENWGKREAFVA
jgi:DNA polymerase-1